MLNIRLIEKKDISALAKLFTKVYEAFDIGERWTETSSTVYLQSWLDKQPDLAYLAELDGEIVGAFFSSVKPWWDGVHLFDGELFVSPDFQKKKIGSTLLKAVLEKAVQKYGAKTFDAFTFNGTPHPLSWYKKLGFQEIKEWTMFTGDIKEVLKNIK